MKCLLVDDHPVARRGLTVIVKDSLPGCEVFEAWTAEFAVDMAAQEQPDLILVDARIPDSVPPAELCRRLRAVSRNAHIAIVTAFEDTEVLRECLMAGATGCLLKDTSEIDLSGALRQLLDGDVVIDPRIADRLVRTLVRSSASHDVRLSARELDVLRLLSHGASNRSIASRLDLSEATVKGYVTSLLKKLGASSRLEAVVRAHESGTIDLGRGDS